MIHLNAINALNHLVKRTILTGCQFVIIISVVTVLLSFKKARKMLFVVPFARDPCLILQTSH